MPYSLIWNIIELLSECDFWKSHYYYYFLQTNKQMRTRTSILKLTDLNILNDSIFDSFIAISQFLILSLVWLKYILYVLFYNHFIYWVVIFSQYLFLSFPIGGQLWWKQRWIAVLLFCFCVSTTITTLSQEEHLSFLFLPCSEHD